jgi:hypothetical protein
MFARKMLKKKESQTTHPEKSTFTYSVAADTQIHEQPSQECSAEQTRRLDIPSVTELNEEMHRV